MKKTINENTLKSIIKESLKNYLKESMDSELGMEESTEGWTPEMDDMWDEFGNNNVHDTDGAFGVLAQGEDDDQVSRIAKSMRSTKFDTDANMGEFEDEADEFASDDNAEYLRGKMFESVVKKAVNEAFAKVVNEVSSDLAVRAGKAAQEKRRYGQMKTFNDYARTKANTDAGKNKDMFGLDNTISEINHELITFKSAYSNPQPLFVTLFNNGEFRATGFQRLNLPGWFIQRERFTKAFDKATARQVAKWWSNNGNVPANVKDRYPELDFDQMGDWHFWANL